MNFEFVSRLQTVSGQLSLLNSSLLLAVGVAFLVFPQWVLTVLLDYNTDDSGQDSVYRYGQNEDELWDGESEQRLLHHEDPIDSVVSLVGGVLVAQGLACLMLLYPMMSEGLSSTHVPPLAGTKQSSYSQLAIWNVRSSVTIQLITGLMWIVVALYDDRGNEAFVRARKNYLGRHTGHENEDILGGVHRRTTFGLLLVGFSFLVLGCLSLMLTFWPATNLDNYSSSRSTTARDTEQDLTPNNDNLTEPLLSRGQGEMEADDEIETRPHHDATPTTIHECDATRDGSEDPVTQSVNDPEHNANNSDDENHADEPTSRIRGTQRLLAVAAPQVVYLYIGCITLLIRLPFSLSIPHFVSTTLGALADGEFDRARREIVWLFVLGTIDAFLDFWCIFCKLGDE